MGKKIGICLALGFVATAIGSTVNVDLDEEHQVIRGFGGMVHTAWEGYGLTENEAQLAFGTGDGQIGLNTLRIPVGDNSNGFSADVQAAKNAKKVAGDDFILFATPWTSPYASGGAHVSSANYQKYTDHLNSFAEYMKNQGVPLYAISFQNEPDYCHTWACMSADEIYNYTKGFADQLRKHGTKVISAESFAYQRNQYDKVLNDASALKNWDILGAHFYASSATSPDSWFQYSLADQKNVERWMTEHYTESQGSGNYWRTYMRTGDQANENKWDTVKAMDVGYEIHRALAVGNFSQYTWWYLKRCYGFIMDKDYGNKLQIPQNEIGKVSKRGYVASQFARFVRPGAIRIGATINPEPEVYASAYKSANEDSVIVVLVNRDYKNSKTVTINVSGADVKSFHMYTTSEAKNALDEGEVEVNNGSVTITMDAGNTNNKDCIVTLVGTLGEQVVIPRKPYDGQIVVLPGRIDTEDYDVPGSGKGNKTYSDNDSENQGKSYREDGVDIVKIDENDESKGYAIGYTSTGEWLEYTIKVENDGEYPISANVASGSTTSNFRLLVDGEAITDEIAVPQTAENDWSVYKVIEAGSTTLTAGEHVIRLEITGSYVNIDWFAFGDPTLQNKVSVDGTEKVPAFNRYNLKHRNDNYALYDIRGAFIGKVQASNLQELRLNAKNLVKRGGAYLARSSTGATLRIQIVK
jgi:O-glycosyl hydrolase